MFWTEAMLCRKDFNVKGVSFFYMQDIGYIIILYVFLIVLYKFHDILYLDLTLLI